MTQVISHHILAGRGRCYHPIFAGEESDAQRSQPAWGHPAGPRQECSCIWHLSLQARSLGLSGSDCKVSAYNVGDLGSIPGSGRSPGEGNGNGPRSLVGYSPQGRKELDMTERLHFHFSLSLGLWKSFSRGARSAAGHRVAKSRTRLSDWTTMALVMLIWHFFPSFVLQGSQLTVRPSSTQFQKLLTHHWAGTPPPPLIKIALLF